MRVPRNFKDGMAGAQASGPAYGDIRCGSQRVNGQAGQWQQRFRQSWSASAAATGYNVKRSGTSGGPYARIASISETSYTDAGLAGRNQFPLCRVFYRRFR